MRLGQLRGCAAMRGVREQRLAARIKVEAAMHGTAHTGKEVWSYLWPWAGSRTRGAGPALCASPAAWLAPRHPPAPPAAGRGASPARRCGDHTPTPATRAAAPPPRPAPQPSPPPAPAAWPGARCRWRRPAPPPPPAGARSAAPAAAPRRRQRRWCCRRRRCRAGRPPHAARPCHAASGCRQGGGTWRGAVQRSTWC